MSVDRGGVGVAAMEVVVLTFLSTRFHHINYQMIIFLSFVRKYCI